jgi:Ca-activated chloride channel family protein
MNATRMPGKYAWILACMALCALVALAQGPGTVPASPSPAAAPQGKNPQIRVDVELVQVPLTVLDPWGRIVTGLTRENFRVFEDSVEQEVLHVQVEEVPISVGIVFDKSGSMGMNAAIQAARIMSAQFFKTKNLEDEFLVVALDSRAHLITPFTESIESVQQTLMSTKPGGMTALNDAIYLALSKMKLGRHARKALIIITDGEENHSRYSDKDVEQAALEADTQIYVIGAAEIFKSGVLGDIAEKTGGRWFTYSYYTDTADHIWNELRNQYILGYRSSNRARDGKWRKIKVLLRVPRGLPPLKVYAKTGYLAPR